MMCSICKVNLQDNGYSYCKECRKCYDRLRYQRVKAKRIEQSKAQRRRTSEWMNAIKESMPCTDCELFWPAYVLEWDHINSDKVGNVSDMVKGGRRLAAEKEIAKCELVCSNCHAIRTHERREN